VNDLGEQIALGVREQLGQPLDPEARLLEAPVVSSSCRRSYRVTAHWSTAERGDEAEDQDLGADQLPREAHRRAAPGG
jgi:hypothetical protein